MAGIAGVVLFVVALASLMSVRRVLALEGLVRRFTPAGNASAAEPGKANEKDLTDPALLEGLRSLGFAAVSAAGGAASASGVTLPDPKDRIQVYELVSAALNDAQQSRYEESLRKLREAEMTDPDLVAIRFLIARDYLHLNDFPHPAEYFESAFKADPKYTAAAYYLGLSQLEMGNLDGAEDSFRRALELTRPTSPPPSTSESSTAAGNNPRPRFKPFSAPSRPSLTTQKRTKRSESSTFISTVRTMSFGNWSAPWPSCRRWPRPITTRVELMRPWAVTKKRSRRLIAPRALNRGEVGRCSGRTI